FEPDRAPQAFPGRLPRAPIEPALRDEPVEAPADAGQPALEERLVGLHHGRLDPSLSDDLSDTAAHEATSHHTDSGDRHLRLPATAESPLVRSGVSPGLRSGRFGAGLSARESAATGPARWSSAGPLADRL